MKKLLLTMTLLGTVFTVSACSGNKDVVSDESSELLAKPEVTQAATKKAKVLMIIQKQMRRENMRKSSMEYMNYIFQ